MAPLLLALTYCFFLPLYENKRKKKFLRVLLSCYQTEMGRLFLLVFMNCFWVLLGERQLHSFSVKLLSFAVR